ncbi:MAG: hypothetical protein FIB06_14240 [Betaproteobacteria bacterium]|nr:hypothetical protein [Betaproteobacteria bacterium]
MIRKLLVIAAALSATSAYAVFPLFAAKCGPGLNVDTNPKGQIYMNGKVAKVIKRPDGQITGNSAGAYVDITPKGSEPPMVTYTARDKSTGTCEILSFKPDGAPAAQMPVGRASHTERAGQGQFDARGEIPCAEASGAPMRQCAFEVAREGGGSATVKVSLPSGKMRIIYFEKGKALGADLSQADGDMTFMATKQGDVFKIRAGKERYEIIEAVVFGG